MLERQGIIHVNGHASINYTNVHVFSPITEFRLGNTLSIFAGYVIKLTCCENASLNNYIDSHQYLAK